MPNGANHVEPGQTILVVDDDPDIREALRDSLEHDGYRVETVEAGEPAIECVRRTRFGAVLLDVGLPDVDGLTVLRSLHEIEPSLPVVIFTAFTSYENTVGSLTKGAFAYLTKPYKIEEIKAILQRALSVQDLAAKAQSAEQALTVSEDRFRSVFQSANDAIILSDQEGRVLSWNQAASSLFGYTNAEIVGLPLTTLMPERYRAGHTRGMARLRATGTSHVMGKTVEWHGLRKNGSEFPLELSLGTWTTPEGTYFSGIIRDITDRRRAQDALERMSRQNALLLNAAGEGIYGLDLEGRTTFTNPAAARMLGYDLEALIGTPMHSVLHHTKPDGSPYPREDCPIYAAFKDGLVHHCDHDVFWRKDGTCFPVDYVSTPIREEGRLVGAVVVFQDITERKRAEAALRNSEERFRQVSEHIKDVIWMTAPDKNHMLYINPAYEAVWGRSTKSLYEQPLSWLDAIHPDDRERVRYMAQTKQVSGEYDETYRLYRSDGSLRWIHDRAFPISDERGAVYRIAGIAEDITDRKLAEDALRRSSDEMQHILAGLPGAILIVNENLLVTYANALAFQHFGSTPSPLVGSLIFNALPLTSGEWAEAKATVDAPILERASLLRDREFNRGQRVYRYRPFPVSLPGHDRPSIGLVIWDMTDQRQLEEQLIQAEKLATLGTLISGMAHEINNPMQGILGLAELIREEENPERIREFARDIASFSGHVSTVVRDFCMYARPAGRDGDMQVDLNERLAEAVKIMRHSPEFDKIEVVTRFQALPAIKARRAEIDQVFVNLICNAGQAMKGGGLLTLSTSCRACRDHTILVDIADTGSGIPEAVLSRIFDPFFTTKEPGKGTGLGLSITDKIVKKYGGTIAVESEQGKGTTFTLTFPVDAPVSDRSA
jgi:PAS domain S-box-containing protein